MVTAKGHNLNGLSGDDDEDDGDTKALRTQSIPENMQYIYIFAVA